MTRDKSAKTAGQFLKRHEGRIEEAGMLLWCEPKSVPWARWQRRRTYTRREVKYHATVLISTDGPYTKRRVFTRHLSGPSVTALKRQLRDEGLSAPGDLRDRCEAAGCSPRIEP